ncbi:MAG: hypothetical protein RIE77_05225 [Phycisphaerales bacterium]|jgi:hypothetical protein
MYSVGSEHEGHMPSGLTCLHCRYDLGGLDWGHRCPECGFPAPTSWPTPSLIEAHPAFIAHLHGRFRDLWHVDACIAASSLLTASAVTRSMLLPHSQWNGIALLLGAIFLFTGGLYGCIALARLSTAHRNARKDLDLPHRRAILWSFVLTVAPFGVLVLAVFFAFVVLSGIWCIIVPTLLTSAIAVICLLVNTGEHASTTIERTGNSPRWTRTERTTGFVTACWPIAILFFWAYLGGAGVFVAILVFVALLCFTHGLRMRHAQKFVLCTLRDRRDQLSAAAAGPATN